MNLYNAILYNAFILKMDNNISSPLIFESTTAISITTPLSLLFYYICLLIIIILLLVINNLLKKNFRKQSSKLTMSEDNYSDSSNIISKSIDVLFQNQLFKAGRSHETV